MTTRTSAFCFGLASLLMAASCGGEDSPQDAGARLGDGDVADAPVDPDAVSIDAGPFAGTPFVCPDCAAGACSQAALAAIPSTLAPCPTCAVAGICTGARGSQAFSALVVALNRAGFTNAVKSTYIETLHTDGQLLERNLAIIYGSPSSAGAALAIWRETSSQKGALAFAYKDAALSQLDYLLYEDDDGQVMRASPATQPHAFAAVPQDREQGRPAPVRRAAPAPSTVAQPDRRSALGDECAALCNVGCAGTFAAGACAILGIALCPETGPGVLACALEVAASCGAATTALCADRCDKLCRKCGDSICQGVCCDGSCVDDLRSDPLNCGSCGNACPGGGAGTAYCVQSKCVCKDARAACGTTCCAIGVPCVGDPPSCGCPVNTKECSKPAGPPAGGAASECVDPLTDPRNCSNCGHVCNSGTCRNGSCCRIDQTECGAACCDSGSMCQNGACVMCPAGQTRCPDGTCQNSCPQPPPPPPVTCTPPCPTGQTCLSGTCAPPATASCAHGDTCVDFVGAAYTVDETKASCSNGTWSTAPCPTAGRLGSCLVDFRTPGSGLPDHTYIIRAYSPDVPSTACDVGGAGDCGTAACSRAIPCVANSCDNRQTAADGKCKCDGTSGVWTAN